MTLDLDEVGAHGPTSEFSQARTKEVEMLNILRVPAARNQALSTPPDEDHQHCEAVGKYQGRLVPRYRVKKSIQACSLCLERYEGPTNGERNAFVRLQATAYYHSCSHCLTVPVNTSVDSRDHSNWTASC